MIRQSQIHKTGSLGLTKGLATVSLDIVLKAKKLSLDVLGLSMPLLY